MSTPATAAAAADKKKARDERKQRVKAAMEPQPVGDLGDTRPRNLANTGPRIGADPDPDSVRVEGQEWIVVSFVSPQSRQKSLVPQTKFRGVFATYEQAHEHALKVHNVDPDFDVHCVKMWHWVPTPPPEDVLEHVRMEYPNQDKLNEIMKGHYDSIERGRVEVEERKKKAQETARKKVEKARAERLQKQSAPPVDDK